MNEAVPEIPAPLLFTDAAANKVRQLIQEEGNPELKLRVFVSGGGCSGFQNPNATSTCGCGSSFSV